MVTLTAGDLKKKQSVRATFKLPQETISLLSMAAKQLGLKQKSLLDRLTDDPYTLSQMVRQFRDFVEDQKDRQQKTFVISRDALLSINTTAKQENISRNRLVEISISRLLPIIAKELKRHNKRKEIVAAMKKHLQEGEILLSKAGKLLGTDDRVYEMLKKQQQFSKENIAEVRIIIERGAAMESR